MTVVMNDLDQKKRESKNYFQNCDHSRFLTLAEYQDIAVRCIGKFAPPSAVKEMLRDEDAISFIVEHLIYGHARWDIEKGRELKSYLNQCVIWAIPRWLHKQSQARKLKVYSTDYNHGEDGDNSFCDIIEDPRDCSNSSEIYWSDVQIKVENLLNHPNLTPSQSDCLRLRYIEGMSYRDIGKKLGISYEWASQQIKKGVKALRKSESNV